MRRAALAASDKNGLNLSGHSSLNKLAANLSTRQFYKLFYRGELACFTSSYSSTSRGRNAHAIYKGLTTTDCFVKSEATKKDAQTTVNVKKTTSYHANIKVY